MLLAAIVGGAVGGTRKKGSSNFNPTSSAVQSTVSTHAKPITTTSGPSEALTSRTFTYTTGNASEGNTRVMTIVVSPGIAFP